jgi:hypothetical protein
MISVVFTKLFRPVREEKKVQQAIESQDDANVRGTNKRLR